MHLLTTFLHILSTGLLLSLFNLSSTCLLASAMPVDRSPELLGLNALMENTVKLFRKPQVGSLVLAKGVYIMPTTGHLKSTRSVIKSPYNVNCAMLVTDVGDRMYKGIVFAEKPSKVLSREASKKVLYENPEYKPLTDMIKTAVGENFQIYAGLGQVSSSEVKYDSTQNEVLNQEVMSKLRAITVIANSNSLICGSFIWVGCSDIVAKSFGFVKQNIFETQDHTRCAMSVIQREGDMYKGIVFAENPNPKKAFSKQFLFNDQRQFLLNDQSYEPLTNVLRTAVGENFQIYAGWALVPEKSLELDFNQLIFFETPLDDRTMYKLYNTFERLLKGRT